MLCRTLRLCPVASLMLPAIVPAFCLAAPPSTHRAAPATQPGVQAPVRSASNPARSPAPTPARATIQSTAISFEDATVQAGLSGAVRAITPGTNYALMSGGGVVGDFNNDGYHDIFMLAGGDAPDYLYINNGDGTFTDQAQGWGVAIAHRSFGASAADFNNDGYLDIFVTSYGAPNTASAAGKMKLYKNNGPDADGNWSFTEIAAQAGVNRLYATTRDGLGSAWGDYDLDGHLDLFVCGYNETRPCNRLFRNNGSDADGNWSFTDVTAQAGLERTGVRGFLPQLVDMNGDRYPELILVADSGTSHYYINNGDGTFTNRTDLAQGIETTNAMGIDIGDINNDGLLDMYISSITYPITDGPGNVLLIQNPDNSFTNTARQTGTYAGYWGWGVLAVDFDHDGDRDLAETNGYAAGFGGDPAVLFENTDRGVVFNEIAAQCGFIHNGQGRGMVRLDIENDGDIDILIFEYNDHPRLYRNNLITDAPAPGRHWIRATLDTSARDTLAPGGIGAMVRVITADQTQLLPMHSGSSHASASPIEVHTGIGAHETIDIIQVAWPDGSYTTVTDVPADQILRIAAPATSVDYQPDALTDVHDITAFLSLYMNADLRADHNGDLRLNFFDISAFISDYRAAVRP